MLNGREAGAITWEARAFNSADLDGIFLVIAATNSRDLNAAIFHEARQRNILCNVVDDPEYCDFYYPAVVRRGDLQMAISTNGQSPALAQRIRRELEIQFGPEYGEWLERIGTASGKQLFASKIDPEQRRRLLHELASREAFKKARETGLQYRRKQSGENVMTGKVYLVGAGPGDPELLTLKALKLLKSADVVLHDDLIGPEILAFIPSSTEIQNVGKRFGHKRISQAEINALMVQNALLGLQVVRLKSGDPLIFGRAGEEMEALRQAGIEFEIVPGVTAAFGAAANAQIPLTHRQVSSAVGAGDRPSRCHRRICRLAGKDPDRRDRGRLHARLRLSAAPRSNSCGPAYRTRPRAPSSRRLHHPTSKFISRRSKICTPRHDCLHPRCWWSAK